MTRAVGAGGGLGGHAKSPSSSSSLKAKAQKIGKKACVLFSSNDNHEENNGHSW